MTRVKSAAQEESSADDADENSPAPTRSFTAREVVLRTMSIGIAGCGLYVGAALLGVSGGWSETQETLLTFSSTLTGQASWYLSLVVQVIVALVVFALGNLALSGEKFGRDKGQPVNTHSQLALAVQLAAASTVPLVVAGVTVAIREPDARASVVLIVGVSVLALGVSSLLAGFNPYGQDDPGYAVKQAQDRYDRLELPKIPVRKRLIGGALSVVVAAALLGGVLDYSINSLSFGFSALIACVSSVVLLLLFGAFLIEINSQAEYESHRGLRMGWGALRWLALIGLAGFAAVQVNYLAWQVSVILVVAALGVLSTSPLGGKWTAVRDGPIWVAARKRAFSRAEADLDRSQKRLDDALKKQDEKHSERSGDDSEA